MDIITQGLIGATFAQSFSNKKSIKIATVAGFLGGLAADSDGFIRSSKDSLLSIEYHRHFTHSILFIPFGALIVSLIIWLFLRRKEDFKQVYLFAFLGYATHGILDACTSYGTRLFWPFSNERIAWDNVAIIDPFFTIPLLIAMIWGLKTKNTLAVRGVFAVCVVYLYLGIIQRNRAIETIQNFAQSNGQVPMKVQAKPTIGQLVLWKTIYVTENNKAELFYNVNAVRLGIPFLFDTKIYPGETAPVLDSRKHFADLNPQSTLYKDIFRFEDFSSGMVILMADNPNVIGDVRYSLLPNQIKPLWGISIDITKPDEHANFLGFRAIGERDWTTYWSMIVGTHPAQVSL
ncbi:MAG: metal-dependent hydrolase [Bdellovibrionota bacterium]